MTGFAKGPPPLHRRRSLRTRITVWYVALLGSCLVAYSVAVGFSFSSHANADLDRRVHEDIELASRALVLDEAGEPAWAGGFLGKQIAEEEGGGHYVEVFGDRETPLLSAGTMAAPLTGRPHPRHGTPETVHLPSGPVRVMSESLQVGSERFLVRAAVSEAGVRHQIRELWIELAVLSLVVLSAGALGGWFVTGLFLGPLSRLAGLARGIGPEWLRERLDIPDSSAEVDQVRDAFNGTLARLESSFEHLRRFTADASHELRTPLTTLKTVGEVGLRNGKGVQDYKETIETMLEEVDRLARVSEDLLALARAESGQSQLSRERVDLASIASEVAENLSVLAEDRGQEVETFLEEGAWVRGDRRALRRAVMNLLDNAIKYSPAGSTITVRTAKEGPWTHLSVSDEGPGIATEHQSRIFERFYRIDPSRSRDVPGSGLGLALVKWTAEAHGGRVTFESAPGKGSTFRLVLPLAID